MYAYAYAYAVLTVEEMPPYHGRGWGASGSHWLRWLLLGESLPRLDKKVAICMPYSPRS